MFARSTLRRTVAFATIAVGLVACLDVPSFVTAEGTVGGAEPGAPSFDGRSPPRAGDEPMVRVPLTTLGPDGALGPNNENGGPGKGKGPPPGKGPDKPDKPDKPPPKEDPGGEDAGDGGGDDGSGEASLVVVPAFWIDAYEVGVAPYAACVAAGACPDLAVDEGCSVAAGLVEHPVTCASFDAAQAYCAFRGKRLPTADEWRAVAAGAAARTYPWGDAPPTAAHANACGTECRSPGLHASSDGWARTAPRGTFPSGRTPDGAFDVAGNVAEWVVFAGGPRLAGGAYDAIDAAALASTSLVEPADVLPATVGFRCARDDGRE